LIPWDPVIIAGRKSIEKPGYRQQPVDFAHEVTNGVGRIKLAQVKNLFIWLLLALVIIFWAGAFAAIRYIVVDCKVSPSALLIFRFLPTSIISILALLLFYRKVNLKPLLKHWVTLLGISILWLFGYHLTLNIGETVIPAGPAGLIIGTYPIATLFLAAVFLKEKLTWQKVTGGLLGFSGIILLVLFGSADHDSTAQIEMSEWIKYGLITLIAPISAAFQTILSKPLVTGENRDGTKFDPILMTFLYMAPAIVLLIPFLITTKLPPMFDFGPGFWCALAFLIFGSTFIAYIGWLWGVKIWGAGRTAATTTYAIPVVSLVIAWMFLNETLGPMTIVAAVVIIAGVVITNLNGIKGK